VVIGNGVLEIASGI